MQVPRLACVCLLGLLVIANADLTDKEAVQQFANGIGQTVLKVQASSPPEFYASLANVEMLVNQLAGEWYQIDEFESQQSRWDLLVQLSNAAVNETLKVASSLPKDSASPPSDWGSQHPRSDLRSVAKAICDQVALLQPYAQETFGVQLHLSNMTACAKAVPKNPAYQITESTEAAAPAPAVMRRRLLAA